jgi:PBP1b-binding outer membrane lipoprotein LpoB
MKRICALLIMALLLLVGCSSETTPATSPQQSSSVEQAESDSVKVEREIFDVKLNLPASLFEGQDLEAVKKEALAEGVHEVTINADGSLTYIMSKSQYREMMDRMGESINDSITEFLASEDNKGVFKEIKFNKDYTLLTAKVDSALYTDFDQINLRVSGLVC